MRHWLLLALIGLLLGGIPQSIHAEEQPPAPPATPPRGLRYPLRLGWLPLQWLGKASAPTWIPMVEDELARYFSTINLPVAWTPPGQIKQAIEKLSVPLQGPPTNQQIIQLALSSASDVIICGNITQAGNQYWVWLKAMSGANGYVLDHHQRSAPNLDYQQLQKWIEEWLKAADWSHWTPGIVDIGTHQDSGTLRVETSPEQIHFKLNQKPLGQTPLLLRHLPPGEHWIEVAETYPFEVSRLKISSEPSGLPVKINGVGQGITPLTLNQNVFTKAGDYLIEMDTNARFKARIEIQTRPEGIAVQINGSTINRTPIVFQNLGDQKLWLQIHENQIRRIRQPITIHPHTQQQVFLELYKPGQILLNSSEANTEVFIDNEKMGETPFSSQISPGNHIIELKKLRFIAEKKDLHITPGKTHEYSFLMRSARSLDTSTFLVPTAQISQQVNIGARYFGFGQYTALNQPAENIHLFGVEADYGLPDLFKPNDWMNVGISFGAFFYVWQGERSGHTLQGPTFKVQLLREGNEVPVSAAIGGYWNIGTFQPGPVGFIAFSRSFSDFMFHFGIQTHGINANLDYTGIANLKLGAAVFLDSFFGVLTGPNESMGPLYGVTAGYSF